MKLARILAVLLAVLLMTAALAEDSFGFDFDDEGYTGMWMDIPGLGLEFCLPDGWTPVEAGEGVALAAVTTDGDASLEVRLEDENVTDILDWAATNLSGYNVDTAGFFDTLYVETDDSVSIYRLNYEDQLIAFRFTRANAFALGTAFALEIVDSVGEGWYEDSDPFDDFDGDALADIQALEGADD